MKPEVQAKFLQHLNRKNKDGGFTLIELLVVIIIIGILAAIALPSFLSQANKGKQSEAKQYTGAMNRSQQAYFLEKGTFSANMDELGVGLKTQTENYAYTIVVAASDVSNLGSAIAKSLKSYGGNVYLQEAGANSDSNALAILCETTSPSPTAPAVAGQTDCVAAGAVAVK